MKLTMFAQLGRFSRRAWWGGALTGLLLAAGATAIGDVTPEGKRLRDAQRGSFSLFSGPTAVLRGNQLQCGVDNQGNVCTDVFNSPTGGGGFWPTGSVNQYIFNTGLQIAGIHSEESGPWANDTVAAYFFDARGTQQHSAPLQDVFDSQNPDDLDNWPPEAFVLDTDLFQPVLVGRKTASQQDSWTQYWDGDPARNSNRKHPMGIQVTQRSLAWNFPSGNESVIYFIYDFENVTGEADFQGPNEAQFFGSANALPDGGFRIDEVYASFSTDMDVTSTFDQNFSTAILPFDMGISYQSSFGAPEFTYPPSLFFPPFFTNAPGIVGVKYLQSPVDPGTGQQVGLTLFSNTQNPSSTGAQFIDPLGDEQLWRYLSGKLDPALGDPPCNVSAEIETGNPATTQRSVCFVFQQSADTRFYQASGPFSLEAGQSGTIVVAYIAAPTVATMPDGTPSGINPNSTTANDNAPGFPSFHPGFQSDRGCDAAGLNCSVTVSAANNAPTALERGAGWFQYNGVPPAESLESPANKLNQFDVDFVPGSLIGRSLVAQTIFDNKFLLGFAPEAPQIFLVPGDGSVTVIWDISSSEATGDPFFTVAFDNTSALFNPNYREFDVEGYRIWRGTNPSNLELMAQFDYETTTFVDFTCETVRPDEDVGTIADVNGTPTAVVGFASGETCGIGAGGLARATISDELIFNNGSDGGPPGAGIVRTVGLSAIASSEDTVGVTGADLAPTQRLTDTGVPFTFSDNTVVNNFTYFYSVSTFDLNSVNSGPASLRSARPTKNTVPRQNAPNLQLASFESAMTGDDGVPLNPGAPLPTIDSETGVFSGPMPPSDAFTLSFAPLVERLLPAFTRAATIDSIVPIRGTAFNAPPAVPTGTCPNGENPFGACWQMFLTADNNGVLTPVVVESYTPWWNAFGEDASVLDIPLLSAVVEFDPTALAQFGIPSGAGTAVATAVTEEALQNSAAIGPHARRFGARLQHGGSRWFDGSVETANFGDPTAYIRQGHLEGIDTVWAPNSHTMLDATTPSAGGQADFEKQCFVRSIAYMARAADVRFTWGGGTFSEVRDVTHNVDVQFSPKVRPTWGFLTTDANGNGLIDWQDFNFLDPVLQILRGVSGGDCDGFGLNPRPNFDPGGTGVNVLLDSTPTLVATTTEGLQQAGIAGLAQTGTGFGLYVNGQRFIFEMSELPADGTVWTLRSYQGRVRSSSSSAGSADPSGYSYRVVGPTGAGLGLRTPMVPGLTFNFSVATPTEAVGTPDLSQVHTVPDPYLGTSNFDLAPTTKQLMFVNLPSEATIRVYSLTGKLVAQVEHNDPTGGGRTEWDLRNRNNQFVASGVYFFHVQTPAGDEHVGKMTIINSAGAN